MKDDCLNVQPGREADPCLYPAGHSGLCSWANYPGARVGRRYSSSFFDKVAEFHRTAQVPAPAQPSLGTAKEFLLSLRLIDEEITEMREAWAEGDVVEFADAIADLTYVALRVGYIAGLPMNEIFEEVHRSNMSKFPNGEVLRREDGKILKPDSWTPPNLKEIIDNA